LAPHAFDSIISFTVVVFYYFCPSSFSVKSESKAALDEGAASFFFLGFLTYFGSFASSFFDCAFAFLFEADDFLLSSYLKDSSPSLLAAMSENS
jgi:hypothetical protein